jgi:hypothetical protein
MRRWSRARRAGRPRRGPVGSPKSGSGSCRGRISAARAAKSEVAAPALHIEAYCHRECLDQGGLGGAVLAHHEHHRQCQPAGPSHSCRSGQGERVTASRGVRAEPDPLTESVRGHDDQESALATSSALAQAFSGELPLGGARQIRMTGSHSRTRLAGPLRPVSAVALRGRAGRCRWGRGHRFLGFCQVTEADRAAVPGHERVTVGLQVPTLEHFLRVGQRPPANARWRRWRAQCGGGTGQESPAVQQPLRSAKPAYSGQR